VTIADRVGKAVSTHSSDAARPRVVIVVLLMGEEFIRRSSQMPPERCRSARSRPGCRSESLQVHEVVAAQSWGSRRPGTHWTCPTTRCPTNPAPRDRGARPSLDEVLALRADRMATVRHVIADLTDEKLTGMTEPVMEPGYPEPESFPVRQCLEIILNEEWEHRLYAERDFDVLESRAS
jgi:hypothetical protein